MTAFTQSWLPVIFEQAPAFCEWLLPDECVLLLPGKRGYLGVSGGPLVLGSGIR